MNDVLRQRQPREINQRHLQFLRRLPCCACALRVGVEAAHIRMGSIAHDKRQTGMGETASDRWAVPLCVLCHRENDDSQHRVGSERAFWERIGIDPLALAVELFAVTGDVDAGTAIVQRYRRRS